MNKLTYQYFLFFMFSFLGHITIYSQNFDTQLNLKDTTQIHLVKLKTGKKHKGRILEINNDEVLFLTKKKKKEIIFSLSEINSIKVQGHLDMNDKKYSHPLRGSTYLFYTNTAFSLQKKQRSYRTFLGASMLLDYGITDNISVGVSYSFPVSIAVNLKAVAHSSSRNYHLGFKSLAMILPEKSYILENSLLQTFGTPDRFFNITFTNYYLKKPFFSFFFHGNKIIIYNSLSFGGGVRLTDRWQFIIENHINFNSKSINVKALPSFGLSFESQQFNIAFGFNSINRFGFNTFPILDFSDNELIELTPQFISQYPYFTYSKVF